MDYEVIWIIICFLIISLAEADTKVKPGFKQQPGQKRQCHTGQGLAELGVSVGTQPYQQADILYRIISSKTDKHRSMNK